MKVELSVFERLWLLNNALPTKSSAANLRIVQELVGVLGITAEEHKNLGLREESDRRVWDIEKERKAGVKGIELSDAQKSVLAKALKDLDEKEELEMALLPLYDKLTGEG
jgi:hypothetical protein